MKPKVDMLWTEDEDEVMREHWPDWQAVARLLPHRSKQALKKRAQNLALTVNTKEKPLTAREERRIRELVAAFSSLDTIAAIVGRHPKTVKAFINRRGWHPKRPEPSPTGHDLYDGVRRRCFDMDLPYRDLDRSLGYSQKHFSRPDRAPHVSIGMIKNAVEALGGRLVIEWEPLTDEDDNG